MKPTEQQFYITTSNQAHAPSVRLARELSARLGAPYVERCKRSLATLNQLMGCEQAVVVKNKETEVWTQGESFHFHPSMAMVRIKTILNGGYDPLQEVLQPLPSDGPLKLLDCTLGLGADAIVASFILGSRAHIVGLEKSPLLAAIVSLGLQQYDAGQPQINAAMRRIEVHNADYRQYLRQAAAASFDFVYFDPMFRHTINKSLALNPVRQLACYDQLQPDDLQQAQRIAKKRVILKSRHESREFTRLGFSELYGGKYAPVQYGIMKGL